MLSTLRKILAELHRIIQIFSFIKTCDTRLSLPDFQTVRRLKHIERHEHNRHIDIPKAQLNSKVSLLL